MKRSTKQLLKRLIPVIALFLAINIGFGIEYYLRVPKEWYTVTSAGEYNSQDNTHHNASSRAFAIDSTKKLAYMASGDELLVLDIDDIETPSLLSSFNKTVPTVQVAFEGDLLVLASSKNFNLLNISNPSSPQNLSAFFIHEGYNIKDVEIIDDMVYLAVAANGSSAEPGEDFRVLYIVDVSNPNIPTEAALMRRSGVYAIDLYIEGDILYLSQERGTRMVDISDPYTPTFYSGYYSAFGLVNQLRQVVDIEETVVKNIGGTKYIFIADSDNGYTIGDVTNPNNPEVIDGVIHEDAISLYLTTNYAFVLLDNGQTIVYSLDKPTKFKVVGKFDPYSEFTPARDIYVRQATSVVFILRLNGLAIYNLVEGVKNDYYREEASFSYTWIAIGLSLLICVPLAISAIMRNRDKYAYSSKY